MSYSIIDTYKMKREIVNFSKKISCNSSAADQKFLADMLYGMLASQSCLLTKISHALQEKEKKIYTVDRLSDHLKSGTDPVMLSNYRKLLQKMVPSEPVIHVDDSDVVKPEGYHFESLGLVRDGSKSASGKSVYSKGYHNTGVCSYSPRLLNPLTKYQRDIYTLLSISAPDRIG